MGAVPPGPTALIWSRYLVFFVSPLNRIEVPFTLIHGLHFRTEFSLDTRTRYDVAYGAAAQVMRVVLLAGKATLTPVTAAGAAVTSPGDGTALGGTIAPPPGLASGLATKTPDDNADAEAYPGFAEVTRTRITLPASAPLIVYVARVSPSAGSSLTSHSYLNDASDGFHVPTEADSVDPTRGSPLIEGKDSLISGGVNTTIPKLSCCHVDPVQCERRRVAL